MLIKMIGYTKSELFDGSFHTVQVNVFFIIQIQTEQLIVLYIEQLFVVLITCCKKGSFIETDGVKRIAFHFSNGTAIVFIFIFSLAFAIAIIIGRIGKLI